MNKKKLNAAYYQKNRKKLLKRTAIYYQKNRKKISEWSAIYRQKNRKKILKRMAIYRQKNRKKISEWRAIYRQKNHSTMPVRHRAMLNRHRHQLAPRGIIGVPMSLKAHQKQLYFANGQERPCWYCLGENNKCGSGLDRLNNNITYTVKNTVSACRGCNTWRGSTHTIQETRDHFKPMRDAARVAA